MRLGSVFFVGVGFTLAVLAFLGGYLVLVDDVPTWTLFLGAVSLVFLVLVPTMLGFSIANLPSGIPREEQNLQLRTVAIAGALSFVLGLVGLLVVGSATPTGMPVIVILIVGSVVVIPVSALVGLRRRRVLVSKGVDVTVPLPVPRATIIRKSLWVAVTMAFGTVAGSAALAAFALYLGDPDSTGDVGSWLLFGFSTGLIAGSIACIAVSWVWVPAMRAEIGDDPAVQKAVRAAVFGRGEAADLDDDVRMRATRWAALQAVHLPFAAAQLGLLMLGLLIQALWNLIVGNVMGLATFTVTVLIVSAVLLVVAVAVGVIRAGRARRFVDDRAAEVAARRAIAVDSVTD